MLINYFYYIINFIFFNVFDIYTNYFYELKHIIQSITITHEMLVIDIKFKSHQIVIHIGYNFDGFCLYNIVLLDYINP